MVFKKFLLPPFFLATGCLAIAAIFYVTHARFFWKEFSRSQGYSAITLATNIDVEAIPALDVPPIIIQEPEPKNPTHLLGFTSNQQELADAPTTIKGNFPQWLSGSFMAIGPSVFEVGSSKANHWLDGLAMVHRFSIHDGAVTYSNKLVKSNYYKECCKKGRLKGGTPEKKSTWAKLAGALTTSNRPIYDNTNINVACFNKQLFALTETPYIHPLDKTTLNTQEPFKFSDTVSMHFCSAHPIFDVDTQEWYGIAINYAHTSSYIVYKMKADSTQRIVVATIPVGYPAYMHSFALTKNYVIITEHPFIVSPYDLLLTDDSYINTFSWKPKNGTNFIVIDRNTGKKVGVFKTEPFFSLHHVNAFEKDERILIDLIAYKDPEIIKAFCYKNLTQVHAQLPQGHLKRFIINPASGKVITTSLSSHNVELPAINPAYLLYDYRYVYATSADHGIAQQLIKIDLNSARHHIWQCKGCYPTEPVFIAKPNSKDEDDGIILSLVLDALAQKSFVVILDAKNLKEIARIYAPHHIPFTVHSKFFNT
jgi:beta,beta-carotene 9',10'-dioxygenase